MERAENSPGEGRTANGRAVRSHRGKNRPPAKKHGLAIPMPRAPVCGAADRGAAGRACRDVVVTFRPEGRFNVQCRSAPAWGDGADVSVRLRCRIGPTA